MNSFCNCHLFGRTCGWLCVCPSGFAPLQMQLRAIAVSRPCKVKDLNKQVSLLPLPLLQKKKNYHHQTTMTVSFHFDQQSRKMPKTAATMQQKAIHGWLAGWLCYTCNWCCFRGTPEEYQRRCAFICCCCYNLYLAGCCCCCIDCPARGNNVGTFNSRLHEDMRDSRISMGIMIVSSFREWDLFRMQEQLIIQARFCTIVWYFNTINQTKPKFGDSDGRWKIYIKNIYFLYHYKFLKKIFEDLYFLRSHVCGCWKNILKNLIFFVWWSLKKIS